MQHVSVLVYVQAFSLEAQRPSQLANIGTFLCQSDGTQAAPKKKTQTFGSGMEQRMADLESNRSVLSHWPAL